MSKRTSKQKQRRKDKRAIRRAAEKGHPVQVEATAKRPTLESFVQAANNA